MDSLLKKGASAGPVPAGIVQYTIAAATGSAPARVGIGIKRPSLVDGLYPFQEALTRSPMAMMPVIVVVMPIVAMTAVAEAKAAIYIRPTVVVMMTSIPYLLRLACCLRGSGRH